MAAPCVLAFLSVILSTYGVYDVKGNDADCMGETSLCRRVGELERLVSEQTQLLQQLQTTVFEQGVLIHQQSARLDYQANLIKDQDKKITWKNNALNKVQTEKFQDRRDLPVLRDILKTILTTLKLDRENFGDTQTTPSLSQSTVTADSHRIRTRNDDPPRLQTVVDHMGVQLTQVLADLQAQTNINTQQASTIQKLQNVQEHVNPASTFVQWGRSNCSSSSSQLVYSGVAGGGLSSHFGSPANTLCMSMNPVPGNHSAVPYTAFVYGAEYWTYDAHDKKNALCAVCRAPFSSTVMIPGTDRCSHGWHVQYQGFLMGSFVDHAASSDYICVDSAMESSIRGDASEGGKELFYVTAQCGSLPCEPYKRNQFVTCVVCSK